ncbi:MAG: hypothetical protein IJ571_00810 [Ruminococcus sp.]|nr:hypothetical protein [Ruminococcus sp.]
MSKKIITALVLTAVMCSVIGCGNTSDSSENTTSTAAISGTEKPQDSVKENVSEADYENESVPASESVTEESSSDDSQETESEPTYDTEEKEIADFSETYTYSFLEVLEDQFEKKCLDLSFEGTEEFETIDGFDTITADDVANNYDTYKYRFIMNGNVYEKLVKNDKLLIQIINDNDPDAFFVYEVNRQDIDEGKYYYDSSSGTYYWNINEGDKSYSAYECYNNEEYMPDYSNAFTLENLLDKYWGFLSPDADIVSVSSQQISEKEIVERIITDEDGSKSAFEIYFDMNTGMPYKTAYHIKSFDRAAKTMHLMRISFEPQEINVPDFSSWTLLETPKVDGPKGGYVYLYPEIP